MGNGRLPESLATEVLQELLETYERLFESADEKGKTPTQKELYLNRINGLKAAIDELEMRRAWARPIPARYGDLSDLPSELLAQLSGVKTDELEDQIYAVVKAAGESIELDNLLITLYRRHGDIHERRFLNNKCYRMVQKGLIFQIPGRKGVYSVHAQADGPAQDNVTENEDVI